MGASTNGTAKGTQYTLKHSNRVYKILEYNYIIFPITLILVFYVLRWIADVTGHYVEISEHGWTESATTHCTLFIIFLLLQMPPYGNTLGLCLPMRPNRLSDRPKTRRLNILRVCLVTKGTNVQTALNSARCWHTLAQRDHPCVRFHVLVDARDSSEFRRQLPSYVTIDEVPDVVPVKRAKYKARALEHFRQKYQFTKDDWILHLDEESEIDSRSMRITLDFIERGTADVGMGTIYYTSQNHWKNPLLSAAEVMRLAEDYGRFQLPFLLFRRPFLGWVHGSWILMNGEVEQRITWDTDNVCEDYWFGYHAAAQGYKFEWLHALVREQPPCTFQDLWNQRRRWYTGITSFERAIVRFAQIFGVLGGIGTLLFPFITLLGVSPVAPLWYRDWMIWNDAAHLHLVISASFLQDLSLTDVSFPSMLYHAFMAVVLWPVVNAIHIAALLSAMVKPSKGFVIINKA